MNCPAKKVEPEVGELRVTRFVAQRRGRQGWRVALEFAGGKETRGDLGPEPGRGSSIQEAVIDAVRRNSVPPTMESENE